MVNDENINDITPVVDPTLAQTDEVIPAPVDDIQTPEQEPMVPVETIPSEPEPVVPEPAVENPIPCDCPGEDACIGTGCISNPVSIGNFFGTLQESVTITWKFHLKTRIYRFHRILNDFYYGALNLVDKIIEEYQGICGIVEEPFVNCIVGDGKTEGEYLTELKTFIENNKSVISGHSEIDSVIDDFLGLIDTTNYKLASFNESLVKSFDEFCYEDYPEIKESCKYDRYGERSCDDPDDPDYDPDFGEEE